jgi:hypothetical protein
MTEETYTRVKTFYYKGYSVEISRVDGDGDPYYGYWIEWEDNTNNCYSKDWTTLAMASNAAKAWIDDDIEYYGNDEEYESVKERKSGKLVEEYKRLDYVDTDTGVELMLKGYELSGRGRYMGYRFHIPAGKGDDTVYIWYLDDDNWENDSWTLDEFVSEMKKQETSYLPLFVSKEPTVNPDETIAGIPESLYALSNSRIASRVLLEARTSSKPVENPDTVYYKKIDMFCSENNRLNLRKRWKNVFWREVESKLVHLLMHNFPGPCGAFMGYMKSKLPWKGEWIAGINNEFGTTLTPDSFRDAFDAVKEFNRQNGVKEDKEFIKMMSTSGTRGRQPKGLDETSELASSFEELYNLITSPVNQEMYGKKYKTKSLTGKRGRPIPGGTYIEFDMRKMPVIMVRGQWPFSEMYNGASDCYAIAGMSKPKPGESKVLWLSQLKHTFKKKVDLRMQDDVAIDYGYITPCSLEFWLKEIQRRRYTNTDLLGKVNPGSRGRMFKPTNILQLREDGSFRFYSEGMTDNEAWIHDAMKDEEMIDLIGDEFGVKSR